MLQWCHRQIKRFRCQKGQGMTEYIIIVALISVAAVGLVVIFREQVTVLWRNAIIAMRGEEVPTGEEIERLGGEGEGRAQEILDAW